MVLPPAGPVTLTGSRVALSAPVEADIDRVTELCQDPAIAEWTTVPRPYGRTDAEGFIGVVVADGWVSGRSCTWAIRRDGVDGPEALVGMVGLDAIADGQAEIGFWLAPEARGLGLMTEAVALVLDFAFAEPPAGLGLQRVEWHAFAGNTASAAVARRSGFRFEGASRLGAVQRGTRRDDWQAGLLRDDPRTPADGWPAETGAER
ncbi:GNAT family protein [Leifsonia sp. F6_8S_P_1B]|uniref:GNAT family protein n=1 Tax=Leifsonia williamsii TaxID=3035919 RepID=A0ABT8KA81_9MICO|nr:GNAT family protein [Leifsonia williamsii]MDN4614363.1 GNAT family protein [Leifsonia williamsii]